MDELDDADRRLVEEARRATRRSYAPYSRFHVGAALLMGNGEIISGANQENAAFSSGTCAERSACFYAGANFPGVAIEKIAIAAWTRLGKDDGTPFDDCFQHKPISPCGNCRQALMEYENKQGKPIEVLLYGTEGVYRVGSIKDLLPLTFTDF